MNATGLVRLDQYDNSWYRPGGSVPKRALWMLLGQPLLGCAWLTSAMRAGLLRAFGARIGTGVVLKPGVQVKYPWHLEVGDHTWIGEHAWIDNLTTVRLGAHCCVSQGAYLCTGNHQWDEPGFGLRVAPITLGEGSWAGAKSVLLPGTKLGDYAIAAAGAVVSGDVPAFQIFAGNPARFTRVRKLRPQNVPAPVEVH